jgi:hypothetical protein
VRFIPVQNLSKIFAAGIFVLALKCEDDRWDRPWLFNGCFNYPRVIGAIAPGQSGISLFINFIERSAFLNINASIKSLCGSWFD